MLQTPVAYLPGQLIGLAGTLKIDLGLAFEVNQGSKCDMRRSKASVAVVDADGRRAREKLI
jgi:hypothetical protein